MINKLAFFYGLPILILSAFFLSLPSFTAAESQTADRSVLHIAAVGPAVYGKSSSDEKSGKSETSHVINVPLARDLKAFVDFSHTALDHDAQEKTSHDFRTLFGFHITLK